MLLQDLLNRTEEGEETHWFKTLEEYYYRDQWELFDLEKDRKETINVVNDKGYKYVLDDLKEQLRKWQNATNDPWICSPGGVWENKGDYPTTGVCLSQHNDLDSV